MTHRAGVIGAPISHSLSPAIFTAAFEATGLDWTYDAFEVAEGDAPQFLRDELRSGRIEGVSVTMPHKEAVLPALDHLAAVALDLQAVNCIELRDGQLWGHNTDGDGFLDALERDEGVSVAGLRCAVLGAGGSGRAVARALGQAGAGVVVVINRTASRATAAAMLAGAVGRVGQPTEVADAELVVNTTPLGMGDDARLPLDVAALGSGQIVVDIVYHPAVTPLLTAAEAAGARAIGGLGMLVHQAARAFHLWTGVEPPVEAMRAGAVAALDAREGRA